MEEDALTRSLQVVARALDQFTANWFLRGGSCLGYLRHGRANEWDINVGIGIYDPGIDLHGLAERLPVGRYYGIGTRVTEATILLESKFEIFLFFDHDGCVAETLHNYNFGRKEVKLLIYPKDIFENGVERVTFCGVGCNVLRRSHEYCRTLYGDSYLIPDPLYDWWEGPVNALAMNSELMFAEEAPAWNVWDRLRLYWRSQGTRAIARKGFRRVARVLADAARTMRTTRLGRGEG